MVFWGRADSRFRAFWQGGRFSVTTKGSTGDSRQRLVQMVTGGSKSIYGQSLETNLSKHLLLVFQCHFLGLTGFWTGKFFFFVALKSMLAQSCANWINILDDRLPSHYIFERGIGRLCEYVEYLQELWWCIRDWFNPQPHIDSRLCSVFPPKYPIHFYFSLYTVYSYIFMNRSPHRQNWKSEVPSILLVTWGYAIKYHTAH